MGKKEKKKKKGLFWKILLAILAVIIIVIAVSAVKGGKVMNNAIDEAIAVLSEEYEVVEADIGEYSTVKVGPMKFKCKRYDVKDLGSLCVMTLNMGVMQMSSFIMSPYEKDMPEMCLDFVYMFSIRKGYVEFYNLAVDENAAAYKSVLAALQNTVDEFNDMTDAKPDPKWYDDLLVSSTFRSTSSKEEDRFTALFVNPVKTYAQESKKLAKLSAEDQVKKVALIKEYSDNLIDLGGVSTDMFKEKLGEDKTRDFFDKVFYGTALY